MKMVKLGGVLIASMFVMNSFGQTQTKVAKKAAAHEEVAPQVKQSPEEQAKTQTEKLNKILNLTGDQYAKIYETNMYVNMKNEAVHTHPTWTKEQKQEAFDGNAAGRTQVIKSYLTPEQLIKFEEIETIR